MDRSQEQSPPTEPPHRRPGNLLSAFIRERQDEILGDWEHAVRELPIARDLERPALIDRIPEMLDRIASMADELAGDGQPRPQEDDSTERHAGERLEEGFDCGQIVAELSVLRESISRLWEEHDELTPEHLVDLRLLHKAIDQTIAETVERYTLARERSLPSLDRFSAATVEPGSLNELLDRLLSALVQTTSAVDTVVIFLREGDVLVARAAVGVELQPGLALGLGEGFAGMIAREARPRLTRSASAAPLPHVPNARETGSKALYGVPLIEGGRVIGVAEMGSMTAHDFSREDKELLAEMTGRATSAISQHLLREAAERRASQQGALAAFGQRLLGDDDHQALLDHALRVVGETLGVELASVFALGPDGTLAVEAVRGRGLGSVRALTLAADDESQAGHTARTGRPVIVQDGQTADGHPLGPIFKAPSTRSGMIVPIRVPVEPEPVTYGVLAAHALGLYPFSSGDVHFLEGIANALGAAIALRRLERDRASLLAQAQRDRVELEAVIESIPDAIFIGAGGVITRCNRAARRLLGWPTSDDLRGPLSNLEPLIALRDLETGGQIRLDEGPFSMALRGEPSVRELVLTRHRTGDEVVIRCSAAPILLDAEVVGVVSVASDITSAKRAEETERRARTEAERALAEVEALLSSSLVGIGFIDRELRYLRVNTALAAFNGRPSPDHLGRTVREVLGGHADDLEPMIRKVIETGIPVVDLELAMAPPSTPDRERSFLLNYFPVRMTDGDIIGAGAAVIEITDRKRAEHELLEYQAQFRTLADGMSQLAWMANKAGFVFWYNQRWFDYTGTTLEEMQGWGWQKVHHPDHLERVTEKFRRHLEAGEEWEDTFPMRGKDGRYRWFLTRAVPIRDEHGRVARWFGTNTDVTEQRLIADVATALASSASYRVTLQGVAQVIVPMLADWCAVDLVERDGAVHRVAFAHADPSKAPAANVPLPRRPPGPGAENPSTRIIPLLGRDRTLGWITAAWTGPGRTYEARDVELLRRMARRAALHVDNARLYEEARRAAQLREEVLAVVSHDLMNPLGAIQLAAELLLRKSGLDPRARRRIETVQRCSVRMEHLIGDLLDMASLQTGHLAVQRRPEEADAIVREAVEMHEPAARAKGVELVASGDLRGQMLSCDRDRVLQVFGNLLGNAIKFCRSGDRIRVVSEAAGGWARFVVSDTGPGIPEGELGHIFEPYWSARHHTKTGTGLGLYISKGIVEAHGARLSVESTPGAGASFTFTLPVAEAPPAEG